MPAVPQRAAHAGRAHPARDRAQAALLLDVARTPSGTGCRAAEGVGHLRQRAGAAVGQPLPGVEGRVVHRLGRLQVEQQHRRAAALRDRQQHRRGHVRREEADDQVAAGLAQPFRGSGSLLGVGDEADVDHFAVELAHPLGDPLRANAAVAAAGRGTVASRRRGLQRRDPLWSAWGHPGEQHDSGMDGDVTWGGTGLRGAQAFSDFSVGCALFATFQRNVDSGTPAVKSLIPSRYMVSLSSALHRCSRAIGWTSPASIGFVAFQSLGAGEP